MFNLPRPDPLSPGGVDNIRTAPERAVEQIGEWQHRRPSRLAGSARNQGSRLQLQYTDKIDGPEACFILLSLVSCQRPFGRFFRKCVQPLLDLRRYPQSGQSLSDLKRQAVPHRIQQFINHGIVGGLNQAESLPWSVYFRSQFLVMIRKRCTSSTVLAARYALPKRTVTSRSRGRMMTPGSTAFSPAQEPSRTCR